MRGFEAQSLDRLVVEILGKCLCLKLLMSRDLGDLSLDVALVLHADLNRRQHAGRQSRAVFVKLGEQLVADLGAAEQICKRKSAVYGRKSELLKERIDQKRRYVCVLKAFDLTINQLLLVQIGLILLLADKTCGVSLGRQTRVGVVLAEQQAELGA